MIIRRKALLIRRKALLIRRKASLILGIETSCDETSASLVENGVTILSNVVASSQEMHIKTGGIIPEMAAREQIKCMIPVIQESLSRVHLDYQDIDAIAVTVGPGLIGSLLIGVETAKTLAYLWHKPIVPVNHLLAHVYANWLDNDAPSFSLIALIVSGGHTELILIKGHGKYDWLGGTRDDAAGECFDKVARLLNLGYPGGPAIAAAADKFEIRPSAGSGSKFEIKLPRPMIDSKDFDFSFSGLKTAVLREVTRHAELVSASSSGGIPEINSGQALKQVQDDKIFIYQLAYEVQEAITDVLVEKTVRAAKEYNVKNILLAGGVAANQRLREKMSEYSSNEVRSSRFARTINNDLKVFFPEPKLCTDNAAAIASCAFFNYKPVPWQKIQANPSLSL